MTSAPCSRVSRRAGRSWSTTAAGTPSPAPCTPTGRSESVLAEELGGADLVSANLYRLDGEDVLKPCEMPADKVLAFLEGSVPADGA